MNNEIWKTLEENKNYQVSNLGRVRSVFKGEGKEIVMKPVVDKGGYLRIGLSGGSRSKHTTRLVHQLVALAFIPNPSGYREINHIDGNKLNNTVSNLEWCSRSHNVSEAFRLGLKVNKKGSESDLAKTFFQFNAKTGAFICMWGSLVECAKYLAFETGYEPNVIRTNLTANLHNRIKTCCGYIFSFKEDIMPELASHKWEMGQKGVIGVRRDLKGNVVEQLRFESVRDVAMAGFDPSLVCKCLKGKRQSHKDFAWFYEDEYNSGDSTKGNE